MKRLVFALIFAIYFIQLSSAQPNSCDYKVEIIANSSEFESKDFSWRMRATKIEGVPTNITGTAEIDSLNGDVIRKYKPWANEAISKQKTSNTYTPNLNPGKYRIVSKISVVCLDSNSNNDADSKIIKIKETMETKNTTIQGNNQNIQNTSEPEIINTAKLGSINETKNNTENQTIILKQGIENKTLMKSQALPVEDNIIQLKNPESKIQNKFTGEAAKSDIAYESGNEKAKKLIMPALLALSILLNIILIWKR